MFPHSHSHLHNPGNQLSNNAIPSSAPIQVVGVPGNLLPNPLQIDPQFPMGVLNNQQLALPPSFNPAAYFPHGPLLPFPQVSLHYTNSNNCSQLFGNNILNQPQFFLNGQMNVPNLVQNVNQFLPMQLVNCGPGKSGILPNAQLSFVNENRVIQQPVTGIASTNAAMGKELDSFKAMQNQSFFSLTSPKPQSNAGAGNRKTWIKSHKKNFCRTPRHEASEGRFSKCQLDHRQNAKGNFTYNNDIQEEGQQTGCGKNCATSRSTIPNQVGKKKSQMLSYTMQEIVQWREQRRRNYPTKANMEKKLKVNPAQPDVLDTVAKTRRQQLKEILAKQAELGCEVAEVPSCYLSDSGEGADCGAVNKSLLGKRGKFQNKFNKQGKFRRNGRFQKRRRPVHHDSVNLQDQNGHFIAKQRWANSANLHLDNKNEPSLLKKLLNSDIRRDNKRLLQVFRFIVMNSFFKNRADKTLKFPEVIGIESADEGEISKQRAQISESGVFNESGIAKETVRISEDSSFDGIAEIPEEKFTDGIDDSDGGSDDEANAASC